MSTYGKSRPGLVIYLTGVGVPLAQDMSQDVNENCSHVVHYATFSTWGRSQEHSRKELFIWQNGAGTQSLMNPTFDKHVIERQAKDTNQEIKERTCKEVNYIMKQNIGITLGNSV